MPYASLVRAPFVVPHLQDDIRLPAKYYAIKADRFLHRS
jgi:hypothetical protein